MANGSYKLLRDIEPGDRILSWNGKEFEPDFVVDKWQTESKPTLELQADGQLEIITSKDHLFAVNQNPVKPYEWRKAEEIKNQKVLCYAGRSYGVYQELELAEFLGYMIIAGSLDENGNPQFIHHNKEILFRVAELAQILFKTSVSREKKGSSYILKFSTLNDVNPIRDLLVEHAINVVFEKRRVPEFIWRLDKSSAYGFIAGIISIKGELSYGALQPRGLLTGMRVPSSCEIKITLNSSIEFAWEIYWLLRKFSINPNVYAKARNKKIEICIHHEEDVLDLLLDPGLIYGQEGLRRRILTRITRNNSKQKLWNGCHRLEVKKKRGQKQQLYDIETEKNHNFVANGYVVHNSGKDIVAFNFCIRQCIKKQQVIYYIFPTYAQAKKVIWDSITNDGMRFLDFIPDELIESTNSQEMKVRFKNGSLLQLVGSDNIDALLGSNPQGIVFSEYALQDPRAYQFLRPILVANGGWALFESTPSW